MLYEEHNICWVEISKVGLTFPHWQMNYEVFVKFSDQFNMSEIFND